MSGWNRALMMCRYEEQGGQSVEVVAKTTLCVKFMFLQQMNQNMSYERQYYSNIYCIAILVV